MKSMKSMRQTPVRRTALITGLLAASMGLSMVSAAQDEHHLLSPKEAIPQSLFGVLIHDVVNDTAWPPSHSGGVRFWDASMTWWNLELYGKGQYDFKRMDKAVALAESHGSEIFMNLGTPPPWASARPEEGPAFRKGGAAEPKNMQDWRDYVRTVATRYKGKIHCWEIWNEPNDSVFYTGTTSKLVELSMEAYKILKQVDPSNIVVAPSATYGMKGTSWLDEYLQAGGGAYADVIGYHLYVMPSPPEEMVPLIQKIKSIMAKHGVGDKPLWNTETGWLIQNRAKNVKTVGKSEPLPDIDAAGVVARSYIVEWAAGVSRHYWYDWDGGAMGLADDGGKTIKPAGRAYLTVQKWLVGARMNECNSDTRGTWVCQIYREGGYHSYIVWNPHGNIGLEIPENWKAQSVVDLDGHAKDAKDIKKATVGPEPVLFENKTP